MILESHGHHNMKESMSLTALRKEESRRVESIVFWKQGLLCSRHLVLWSYHRIACSGGTRLDGWGRRLHAEQGSTQDWICALQMHRRDSSPCYWDYCPRQLRIDGPSLIVTTGCRIEYPSRHWWHLVKKQFDGLSELPAVDG